MKESFGRIDSVEHTDDGVVIKVKFPIDTPNIWKSGESVIIKGY